jgi:hypothetical protein
MSRHALAVRKNGPKRKRYLQLVDAPSLAAALSFIMTLASLRVFLRATTTIAFLLPALGRATDYYVGDQAASQPGIALSDLAAVNALSLQPGDRVLLQGGQTFSGSLYLGPDDAGTPAQPVVISSYGTGRATISAGLGAAITIYNAAGFAISRLNLLGTDAATSQGDGIDAGVYLPDSTKLAYLRFDDMAISGFKNGVELWAWYSTTKVAWPGFTDVKLTNLDVSSNRSEGIKTWGTWRPDGDGLNYSHANITIAQCEVWNNRGDPTYTSHTGSGIILAAVNGGLVEYCVAHDNGGVGPLTGGGPFGIWTWESRGVTLQYNLVYNQHTSSNLDGGAYDLDGGSADCVVQYNYSYNNDGPSVGIIQFQDASALSNNVVRYNISENDCRKTVQGIVYVGEFSEPYGISNAEIYGNTFFVGQNPLGGKPPVVSIQNHDDITGVHLRNNLFIAGHSGALVVGVTTNPSKALYQGNNYWGGAFDLLAFRAGGQESLNGRATGGRYDPLLLNAGHAEEISDVALLPTLAAYSLMSDSPAAAAGLDLAQEFGIARGPHDFYGLPFGDGVYSVGAATTIAPGTRTPPPPAPPLPTLLIDDDFTGSGSVSGRTPDRATTNGQKWSVLMGSGTITNGTATANTTFRAVIETGAADAIIETSIAFTTSETGLILRCSDSANYLRLSPSSTALRLLKTQGGTTTGLASKSANFVLGRTYALRVVLSGSTAEIFVDSAPFATFSTVFNQTATRHGIIATNSGVRKWERFTVTRP